MNSLVVSYKKACLFMLKELPCVTDTTAHIRVPLFINIQKLQL